MSLITGTSVRFYSRNPSPAFFRKLRGHVREVVAAGSHHPGSLRCPSLLYSSPSKPVGLFVCVAPGKRKSKLTIAPPGVKRKRPGGIDRDVLPSRGTLVHRGADRC